MEQQKLLWIILSIAIFLVLVVSAGMFLFYPGTEEGTLASSEDENMHGGASDFDVIQYVRDDQIVSVPEVEQEVSDEEQEFVVTDDPGQAEREEADTRESEDIVVTVGDDEYEETVSQETQPVQRSQPTSAGRTEQENVSTAAVPQQTTQEVPSRDTEESRGLEDRTQYWIQAGSFSQRYRAEAARDELAELGLVSRIILKEINSESYFRVRIGPYVRLDEAEQFLEWVQSVEGFSESYISIVYP
ncbi:MAG: SPOR domain-containing protein [Spirochaetia bacterium]